jgi:hypothetical protein
MQALDPVLKQICAPRSLGPSKHPFNRGTLDRNHNAVSYEGHQMIDGPNSGRGGYSCWPRFFTSKDWRVATATRLRKNGGAGLARGRHERNR